MSCLSFKTVAFSVSKSGLPPAYQQLKPFSQTMKDRPLSFVENDRAPLNSTVTFNRQHQSSTILYLLYYLNSR